MSKVMVKVFLSYDCGVCNIQIPLIKDLEDRFRGRVEFEYLNAEDNQDQVSKYKLRDYPTIIIECDGKERERFVGLTQQLFLKRAIEKTLRDLR
jgi:thiol-disulfide isomerase/thioredoxin